MRQAIEAVKSQTLGYLSAAKRYNVPRATLHRLCKKDGSPDTVSKTTLGRKTVLTPELEKELVEYLLLMDQRYFGLTRRDLRSMAFQQSSTSVFIFTRNRWKRLALRFYEKA